MNTPVIRTERVVKRYGGTTAVDGLTLEVGEGEVFGLLGPNGSGKTTTILMILGLTEPSGGTVRVLDYDPLRDPLEVKRRVGYLPDSVGFYNDLTATSNLRYTGRLAGLSGLELEKRISHNLERMGLGTERNKKVGAFSQGMRQRLGLAEILVKEPQIIILDEPTNGLDPEAARDFIDLIRSLKREGITILLSSHLLSQVQAVCDRVGLFKRGKMVLEGTVKELASQVLGEAYIFNLEVQGGDLSSRLGDIEGVVAVTRQGEERYTVEATADVRRSISRVITEGDGILLSLQSQEPSLDDIYTRYFQEADHEA